MNFALTAEEKEFQHSVREWLRTNKPRWSAADELDPARWMAIRRAWQARMHEERYVGIMWPREFGGRGGSATEQLIFNEELVAARAPEPANVIALGMIGPTIITHGTVEQKVRYLAPILAADEIWCQAFSEPDAGSDLSALATRFERRGDHYVVNGQKVWTSFAHVASWCFLLGREERRDNAREGLSVLLVDMSSAGIEVRPLVQMTRDPEFNEVFFEDVVVPASQLLGHPGEGWKVAMTTLLHERGNMGVTLAARGASAAEQLVELARSRSERMTPMLRQRIAQVRIQSKILQLNASKVAAQIDRGGVPGPDASLVKLAWSELNQGVADTALQVLGLGGTVEDGSVWPQAFLRAQANTIEAGTSEILRNILAERVLGLPRSR